MVKLKLIKGIDIKRVTVNLELYKLCELFYKYCKNNYKFIKCRSISYLKDVENIFIDNIDEDCAYRFSNSSIEYFKCILDKLDNSEIPYTNPELSMADFKVTFIDEILGFNEINGYFALLIILKYQLNILFENFGLTGDPCEKQDFLIMVITAITSKSGSCISDNNKKIFDKLLNYESTWCKDGEYVKTSWEETEFMPLLSI